MTVVINGTTGISPVSAAGTSASIDGLTVGRGAGEVATNTAVGASALAANTTGYRNVAVGDLSLDANDTGYQNTAVGRNSLGANTSGYDNSAFGLNSLTSNTTGAANTAVGQNALYSNTTASNNTAVGYQAAYTNSTGNNFAAFGTQAAYLNTTGASFAAFGVEALYSNTTGNYNTALGRQALYSNTTASNNTAVGYQAGYSNTTDGSNTFIGRYAGYTYNKNSSADTYNTFVGAEAGRYTTTGTINGFFGYGAGALVTTGSKNTILGSYNGNQAGLDIRTASNYIVLSNGDGDISFIGTNVSSGKHVVNDGAQFYPGTDNILKLGTASLRWTTVYATTGTINTSDANQKQDIAALDDAEKRVAVAIKSLIKKYRFKDAVAEKGDAARIHVGAVAQEVQAAFVAEGLDPARYALFCSDTWHELDGKSTKANGEFCTAETEGAVEVTRLGLRYEELLAFVIAAL